MGSLRASSEELYTNEESRNREELGKKKHVNKGERNYKSPNLQAERNRRKKLSDRMLMLRGLVPNITNMSKGATLCDAMNYIEELQKQARDLGEQLFEVEAINSEEEAMWRVENNDCEQETKSNAVEVEVEVSKMDQRRLWLKIVFESKRGRFTKLMEAMTFLGLELADTSVTTIRGAIVISSSIILAEQKHSIRGIHGEGSVATRIRELLLEIIRSI